jgi:hypothetical protein
MATIKELVAQLERVQASKANLLENGLMYSVQGSHSSTSETLANLSKEEARIRGRILRRTGAKGRHTYGQTINVSGLPE